MSIEIKDLCFRYDERRILQNIQFSARDRDVVAILGPNGVGKSTFFRCILGFLKPTSGVIRLNGKSISELSRAQIAREIAYIPQSVSPAFNYTVLDTVLMGMTNQLGTFRAPKPEHTARALDALDSLGIAHLRHRGCNQISGGERQLTLLARALVQNARILIMDEPTASLDYGNSFRVMERIRSLGEAGYTVIFSTHEPNYAFQFSNRVLALMGGTVLAEGPSQQVLTEEVLSELYHIGVCVRTVEDASGASVAVSIPYRCDYPNQKGV